MKRNMIIFMGVLTGALLFLVVCIRGTPNSETVTSEPVPSVTEKMDMGVSSNVMLNGNTRDNSSDTKNETLPDPASSVPQEESISASFKKYADAKPSTENDLPFAVQWLSDSEAKQMPVKDILSKARVKSKESFKPRPVKTRQEASDYLNVNVSFADPPSKAFESSDHFFFSAPLTQDFSRGFIINKGTGELATW